MSSTDRLQGIVAQIRTTLARRTERGDSRRMQPGRAPSSNPGRLTLDELRAGLRSGLVGLDLTIPGDRRRARRLFIESVLLSEFGVNLANDSRFVDVVTGVESAFSKDAAVSHELDLVLEESAS